MSRASRQIVRRALGYAPPLLHGLSWSAFALVLLFCALSALETVTAPSRGPFFSDAGDLAVAGLARIPVFLINAVATLVTAIIVLNAAGGAGRERIRLALLAAVIGSLVAAVTRYLVGATPPAEGVAFISKVFVSWLVPAIALTTGCVLYLRARAAREAVGASALRQAALEKQRQEARLRLLQAQIEPHFLFNTLSNIRRLCQSDAAGGRAMLAQMARYLRAALPKFRVDEATLADEIEIVAAYLGLQKIRMGDRLQFALEVAPALLGVAVPPMMLATLVENAIKHGIAPLAEGGRIGISAVREADRLVLKVLDTGRGFAAASGSGVGLANVRARLAALYGTHATLRLEANVPRGVVAVIALPWREPQARP